METPLQTITSPVAISDTPIPDEETRIVMQCHDRIFQDVSVLNSAGEILFTGSSKGIASMSWRRSVQDATGAHIFDLRRLVSYTFKSIWTIETPTGREICNLRHIPFRQRQFIDAAVKNEADKGNEVAVQIRPKDENGLTTLVYIHGAVIAEIQMTEVNIKRGGDRSVWKARVAGGVDLALIVAIMLCRAESQHVWRD